MHVYNHWSEATLQVHVYFSWKGLPLLKKYIHVSSNLEQAEVQ